MRGKALHMMAGMLLAALAVVGTQAVADASHGFFMPMFGDLKAELETARKDKRKGVVLIYELDGCPFCERLKRVALRAPEVRQYYHAHFLVYRIDIKGATAVTGFDGSEATESVFAARQAVRATPTIVFYDLDGAETARLVGPPTDAVDFLLLGRFVAEGHYRSLSFTDFRQGQRKGAK